MATTLYRRKGDQFFTASGAPLNGGRLYFYEAGTTTLQHTYSDAAGLVQNTNPVVLGSDGRLQTAVYFGDTASHEDYKEELKTSLDVTVSPWPFDDIPAATPEASGDIFAAPSFPWEQVSAGTINLTAADTGSAYEADTTSGNVTFNLPSAASAGNGKGFLFKKVASANSLVVDPTGSETIDDVSTALSISGKDVTVGVFSNGAEWYTVIGYGHFAILNNLPEDATPDRMADFAISYDVSASAPKKVKLNNWVVPGALVAVIQDQKAANTAGGTFTAGSDQTRTLNTLVFNRDAAVSLASNQFTLPAGTWEIEWSAPAFGVNLHQSILRDVTAGADVARGTSESSDNSTNNTTRSAGRHRVSIASANVYEIRHACSVTKATTGLGQATNLGTGTSEIYTTVTIRAG